MGNAKASDAANSLAELSPVILMPYALEIMDYHDKKHYKAPFRRYATLAHARSAAKGVLSEVRFYKFSFDTDEWVRVDE